MTSEGLIIGMDVGSTTVKAVVVDASSSRILWSDYQRHQTKQPEKVLELLEAIQAAFPRHPFGAQGARWHLFITGSGAGAAGRADRRQVRAGGQRRHAGGGEACTPTWAR